MNKSAILEALAATPVIAPTRQTIRPFYDFDRCELYEGRAQALDYLEHGHIYGGPVDNEEALWPELRIASLVSFMQDRRTLNYERHFAERLMAWYVSCSSGEQVTLRAVKFVLETLKSMGFRCIRDDAAIIRGIGIGIRRYLGIYGQVPELSQVLNKHLFALLEKFHEASGWELAADIIETGCAGKDKSMISTIDSLLSIYGQNQTGRHSGRHHDRIDEQALWTAAEISYLKTAKIVLTNAQ